MNEPSWEWNPVHLDKWHGIPIGTSHDADEWSGGPGLPFIKTDEQEASMIEFGEELTLVGYSLQASGLVAASTGVGAGAGAILIVVGQGFAISGAVFKTTGYTHDMSDRIFGHRNVVSSATQGGDHILPNHARISASWSSPPKMYDKQKIELSLAGPVVYSV